MNYSRYPDSAGFKGEAETGPNAARDMESCAGRYRRAVLKFVADRKALGATPEEAVNDSGVPRTTLQPRFSELKALGLLVDSGIRRKNASGKRAVVWVLPQYKQGDAA